MAVMEKNLVSTIHDTLADEMRNDDRVRFDTLCTVIWNVNGRSEPLESEPPWPEPEWSSSPRSSALPGPELSSSALPGPEFADGPRLPWSSSAS